jgi:putative ABC transport system permease protein
MLYNYFTIAFRQLRKNRLYASLNLLGLSLSVAACLLITLYVVHECSFDRWNPSADRIVRPVADIRFAGNHFELATVGSFMVPDAAKELPEIQAWCRIRNYGSFLVKREGEIQQNIREEDVLVVDSTFFELFPLKILAGDPARCLTRPNTMAIARSRAEKFFNSVQMALGQTLVLENEQRWQVTAVFEDVPVATHFKAGLLLSMNNNDEIKSDPPYWGANNNFQGYFLLRKGVDKAAFAKKFEALARSKTAITTQQLLGSTPEALAESGQHARFPLQLLPDIHLYSSLTAELQPNGNISYVWILSAIAVFILLIACINFMNLATARSSGRAKEVGVRKALGSRRGALVAQFLSESVLLSALAVGLGIVLAATFLPYFNDLAARQLRMPWEQPLFWAALVAGIGVTGFLAGSYPAFFLSAFNTIQVLKGNPLRANSGGNSRLRSGLVVFQFAISVVLIIGTLSIYEQLNFIQHKKLGFDKNQVVILGDAYALGKQLGNFKEEMKRLPEIEQASISGFLPVYSHRSNYTFSKARVMNKDESVAMQRWMVDSDYLATFGMKMATGRNFDPARITDSTGLLINQSAAKLLGFADPVGQKVFTPKPGVRGTPRPEDFEEFTILGVIEDFHFESLHDNIGPLCMQLGASANAISFRYKGQETATVVAALEKQWNKMAPGQPFSVRFLDEAFGRTYADERRVGKIVGLFALLSILISCLGLFGLATFMAEQRTKEIGIRKVLGASIAGITGLLAKDFLKLVLIAIVIASPLAYYFMNQWLSDFAYRIEMQWWMFALAGVLAVGIAFLTVGGQAVKAALANPVKSLRSE